MDGRGRRPISQGRRATGKLGGEPDETLRSQPKCYLLLNAFFAEPVLSTPGYRGKALSAAIDPIPGDKRAGIASADAGMALWSLAGGRLLVQPHLFRVALRLLRFQKIFYSYSVRMRVSERVPNATRTFWTRTLEYQTTRAGGHGGNERETSS